MPLSKNQIIELDITSVTSLGSGVGRLISEEYPDGFVVFVPQTAVGDKILAKIVKVEKRYAYGIIEKILVSSRDRIDTADCPVYKQCGGCVWRHVSYDAELRYKEQFVKDCIERIAEIYDAEFLPIIGSEEINRYRNKAQYPIGKNKQQETVVGFYAQHSHHIVSCTDCILQPELFEKIVNCVKNWINLYNVSIYDEKKKCGLLRHIYIRQGKQSEQLMICLISSNAKVPHLNDLVQELSHIHTIDSFILNINDKDTNVVLGNKNINLLGNGSINDRLCEIDCSIDSQAFYQVNSRQAEKLYTIARDFADLNKDDILLDLYCGAGTIGLSMARFVKQVIGVEIVPEAIDNAINNAKNNNISNATFMCSDAASAVNTLAKKQLHTSVIVLDPPRKGCEESLIKTLPEFGAERIVYISCNPNTLARDLALLKTEHYKVMKIVPVDMFPRTAHVETVCLLFKMS